MALFKAYDIRGVVPDELDAEIAYGIARGAACYIGAEKLVVGRDARASSPSLCDALIRGLCDEGVDVLDLGLSTTPMVYFAVEHLGVGGGVMVTASHNPPEYNGFKICREHAIPIAGDSGLQDIRRLSEERAGGPVQNARGNIQPVQLTTEYVEHVLSVGRATRPLRVAIDCGNGMAAVALEPLLERLPLEVERLYFEPDGTFPNHPADPLKTENLADLVDAVKRSGADFGVAFDGDADRAIFVDENAQVISADLITALLAAPLLRRQPGAKVLYDLRSSRATAEAIEAAGGVAEMCRVGHSFIKAAMRESGAVFAGELSGHFYFHFSEHLYADDGLAAFVALLAVLAEDETPLSERIRPLRRYSASGEINRHVEDAPRLLDAIEAEHPDAEISRMDGLLVRYPEWWFNLRPSNTEPVLRLNLEARSEAEMVAHRDRILARLEAT